MHICITLFCITLSGIIYNDMNENPFKYGKTVDGPFFYGRERELEEIKSSMRSALNLIIYSPRRMGKSSLVLKALRELEAEGYPTVYIDFFKVTSREKFIELYARELMRGEKNWTRGLKWLQGVIRGIRPVMGLDPGGSPELRLSVDPLLAAAAFDDVINIPGKQIRKKPWVIVFDEFQEIEKLNGDSFEKELRASLQHHQHAGYTFLGSQRHLMLNMFSRRERAFYNFGKLFRLQKLPEEESVQFILERFKAGGYMVPGSLARQIMDQTRNIPFYVQYLCAEVWQLARLTGSSPEEVMGEGLTQVLVNQSDFFFGLAGQLTSYQAKVLAAIASEGMGSYAGEFLEKYRLHPASSLQRAYKRLTDLNILEKHEGRYVVEDPLFEMWLKEDLLS